MDWRLETVVVPVSDVDRAKAFYADAVGFGVDVDHRAGDDFRVVQLTPKGSACSISLMKNEEAAGSLGGLHLVVRDIDEARRVLAAGAVTASDVFHFEEGVRVAGPDPTAPTTGRSSPSVIRTATAGSSRRCRAGPSEDAAGRAS